MTEIRQNNPQGAEINTSPPSSVKEASPVKPVAATPGNEAEVSTVPPTNPFDPANLRLSQDFLSTGGVQKHITSIGVRKPTKEEWFRIHPDYTLDTLLLELKEARETYLIAPALRSELATEPTVSPRRLFVAVNRQGGLFIWPAKLPPADGRQDRWSMTALEAAQAAKSTWVRMQADMALGCYVYYTPQAELTSPQWPEMPFGEILKLAFRAHYVDTLGHIVIRQLRGEV
jgi:hypothetical protein